MIPPIRVERLRGHDLALPGPATAGAAGADVAAWLPEGAVTIPPGGRALIPTGLRVAVPEGFELQLRPRSGLALRHGVALPNAPGTIDADYRGEVGVIVMNHGERPFTVATGDRVAQAVLAPVTSQRWEEGPLDDTPRGAGGFGSTGSGSTGTGPEGTGPEGTGPEGTGPEGTGPEGTGA